MSYALYYASEGLVNTGIKCCKCDGITQEVAFGDSCPKCATAEQAGHAYCDNGCEMVNKDEEVLGKVNHDKWDSNGPWAKKWQELEDAYKEADRVSEEQELSGEDFAAAESEAEQRQGELEEFKDWLAEEYGIEVD